MRRQTRSLVLAIVVGLAAYVVLFRLGEHDLNWRLRQWGVLTDVTGVDHPSWRRDGRFVAHDLYTSYYPPIAYTLRSLRDGGHGLLWNPFQNCGQPFLAMIAYGTLSPIQLIPLVAGPDLAIWLIPFVHLVVAGLGAYLLCRELGAGPIAALCGAIAFELGNATLETAVWLPAINGAYVWLPAALLFCERALRSPSVTNAAGLAVVLALVWLAGFPQLALFAYEFIALRVAWAVVSLTASWRALLAIGTGLAGALLLSAVQMIPSLEVSRFSFRDAALALEPMAIGKLLDWQDFRLKLGSRLAVHQPLVLLPCMLGVAALLTPRNRSRAAFYLASGVLFFVLALGPSTPVFLWYLKLPFAALFRDPGRFTWLTSVSIAVLTALGVEAVLAAAASTRQGVTAALAMLCTLVAFDFLAPDGLRPLEWVLGGVASGATAIAGRWPARRAWIGVVLCTALLLNVLATPARLAQFLLSRPDPLFAYADVFARLQARMTAQDRVYFSFEHPFVSGVALMPKSAMFFGVPSLVDYEPSVSRRYAEFFMMMKTGQPMRSAASFISNQGGRTPLGFNRRLLDLAAGRYVLAEVSVDNTAAALQPAPRLVEEDRELRLYENLQALPRARYVPRIEVVEDAPSLLQRLAAGADDPREVALVEAPPPSGFRGEEGSSPGPGRVEFLRNEPEHVVLRVRAPARGFVVLADQYFPAWEATVNGVPRPIVRANYVFRLVEVPAGESTVEFRYSPRTLWLGALVSTLTLLGFAAALVAPHVRRSL